MCIFSQLFIVFSIFRTPCMAKTHFEYVYLCIWIKHPKGPLLEGKQLQETNFIDLGQICAFLANYSLYFHF